MESLSEYLIEAVARRTTGKYTTFPNRKEDLSVEGIVDVLERNGFTKVNSVYLSGRSGKVYEIGRYEPKSPETFWVKFSDLSRAPNLFFCRLRNFGIRGFSDFNSNGKTVSYDDFREEVCNFFDFN